MSLTALGGRVRAASRQIAATSSAVRDDVLRTAADLLVAETGGILAANRDDLAAATGLAETAVDRLTLTEDRVRAMADGLRTVADLADPVGEVVDGWVRPNGLRVERVRVPLGVVGVIYENRPNVTSDVAGLCLKSGNAAFLRGSASALASNAAIVDVLRRALDKAGLPADAVALVTDGSHETAVEFMRLRGVIDCLVPRGGPALIASLLEHATVPYVLDGDGNCHVYVDAAADLEMAERIVANAKTQRPGVCNAAETLLVHADVAAQFLPAVRRALPDVELVGDDRVRAVLPDAGVATDDDFATEFLGLKLSVAVVDDLSAAVEHIARFSSGHSEAIVTADLATADRFVAEVDAAAVVVNASTRFVDGGELGLGAEVGISTQKLHARGPMGLRELTCVKWIVRGDGQVRQ
jgi:glutamate-5-semialdehyde dehydrogenase